MTFIGANGVESGQFIRKYIRREAGMGAAYERLYQAQRAGRRFKHLPRVLECYWREDFLGVVMEYVRGDTLQELVYRDDPSIGLARNVFPTLCDAVAELHEDFDPPIIHCDLKPSNVILSDDTLTIIDFSIAREFKDGAQADTAHFGTRLFAPPAASTVEPPLGKERKVRPPTSVRNVIIGFFFAFFWMYSLSRIGNPPESDISYPYWYNALTMGFIIPAIVAILAFAAWDKTHLKERFPALHNLRARDYILAFVALMAFFVLCLAFMPAIFGRGA